MKKHLDKLVPDQTGSISFTGLVFSIGSVSFCLSGRYGEYGRMAWIFSKVASSRFSLGGISTVDLIDLVKDGSGIFLPPFLNCFNTAASIFPYPLIVIDHGKPIEDHIGVPYRPVSRAFEKRPFQDCSVRDRPGSFYYLQQMIEIFMRDCIDHLRAVPILLECPRWRFFYMERYSAMVIADALHDVMPPFDEEIDGIADIGTASHDVFYVINQIRIAFARLTDSPYRKIFETSMDFISSISAPFWPCSTSIISDR